MSYISNFRINDINYSNTVITSGLRPLFSWDFEPDVQEYAYTEIEIRISDSSISLGSPLFTGTYLSIVQTTSSNFYQFPLNNLRRGVVYYGQIRLKTTNLTYTSWFTFSFQLNNLPYITNYYIYPLEPKSSENLELNYTYHDLDNHDQHGTKISWYKNNILQIEHNDKCIISYKYLSVGDVWFAKITPSDGLEFGATYESSPVEIIEGNVNFLTTTLYPLKGNIDDIYFVDYTLDAPDEYQQIDGDIIIDWYINDLLTSSGTNNYFRPELKPNDIIYAIVSVSENGKNIISQKTQEIIVKDSVWHVDNLLVDGLFDNIYINNTEPIIEWNIFKSQSNNKIPSFYRVLVTKTQSLNNPIYDTGFLEYVKSYFEFPANVFQKGQNYFVHVVVSDDTEPDLQLYESKEIIINGSSWSDKVDNAIGWNIGFAGYLVDPTEQSSIVMYIHDGTYFCSVKFGLRNIILSSKASVTYTYSSNLSSLEFQKSFKIACKGKDVRVFLNNNIVIDAKDFLSSESKLKEIEIGDLDSKNSSEIILKYIRYSTNGAYGFGLNVLNENAVYFSRDIDIEGGSIDYVFENLLAWKPYDNTESSKLFEFNNESEEIKLKTVSKNFSPITKILINKNRDKYIATSNGVNVISGEKHDPDYVLDTSTSKIEASDFDLISNLSSLDIANVERKIRNDWFTIDTTYTNLTGYPSDAVFSGNEYDPYIINNSYNAIHYYTQRTFGHSWFDNVDNKKGWQVSFSFDLDILEADDFKEVSNRDGFGIYINDGTYQEILYFYEDRIKLFYANVFVSIDTTVARDYVIEAKDKNIKIYQKKNGVATQYNLLLDGNSLFSTPSTSTGNSSSPKIIIDKNGLYHCVWQDDSNKRSQIFYSQYNGETWSNPELVSVSNQFYLRNPVIDLDSNNRVWVAYEDNSWGKSEIAVSVKDKVGWNKKTRITNYPSKKENPFIKIDTNDNAHLVWQDNRNGNYEIYYAQWVNATKSWVSSANYGKDTVVSTVNKNDPYLAGSSCDFINPSLDVINNRLLLLCECSVLETNVSIIILGFKNLNNNQWYSSGSDIIENGLVIGSGEPIYLSSVNRKFTNPSLAVNPIKNKVVVCWEDRTLPVIQIMGICLDGNLDFIVNETQITNSVVSLNNLKIGWISDFCAIYSNQQGNINYNFYDGILDVFNGSNTGGSDVLLVISADKSIYNISSPAYSPIKGIHISYDYVSIFNDADPYLLTDKEIPKFRKIGSCVVEQLSASSVSVLSDMSITSSDTKEFAFGDLSENISIKASWKDIKFYFGYNARPYNVLKLNSEYLPSLGNDLVNDIFVDVFGNVVSATNAGLFYIDLKSGKVTEIEGRTVSYDSSVGCTADTCLLQKKIITSVKWGKNGIWYIGTVSGIFYSKTAGKFWEKLFPEKINKTIYSIDTDSLGRAIIGCDGFVYIAHPDMSSPIEITVPSLIKIVKIDSNNIIWAGSSIGLYRLENFSNNNMLTFDKNSGMSTSYVTDIHIVNNNLRFIATASGVDKMHGSRFYNYNLYNTGIDNNNISSVFYDQDTNSLWIASLNKLYEIVFKDDNYEIINIEKVSYDASELSISENYDKNVYYVLDTNLSSLPLNDSQEYAKVYINKNLINFGYLISSLGNSISFLCNLLKNDIVDISISNKIKKVHDFNQSKIEKEVKGLKTTAITKIERTSRDQLLLLSNGDKKNVLLYAGESLIPFTTVLLDRDPPIGCIEKVFEVTKNIIRFKIVAYDALSGLDGMILSNYDNFTSDGTNALDFSQYSQVVDHNIGDDLTSVSDSLVFSDVEFEDVTYSFGSGSALVKWIDAGLNTEYLYCFNSSPCLVYRYNPSDSKWSVIDILDQNDLTKKITSVKNINNIIWVTTESSTYGGQIYKSVNGLDFTVIGGVTGTKAIGIAGYSDGSVYFGSSDGKIYKYKNNNLSIAYENIDSSIYDITIFNDTLIVATGNKGRIYSIDLIGNNNIIIYSGNESFISRLHIKDIEISTSESEVDLFATSGDYSNIYKANLSDLNFVKSYSSFGKKINFISQVSSATLSPPESPVTGTSVVAAIGDSLYKYNGFTWEFFYKHTEDINYFVQYFNNGVQGLWFVSNNKIVKWTAIKNQKIVYLKLKDKAGNISNQPSLDPEYTCPTDTNSICCNYTYSINISDLQGFVNESKILEISEYGEILFSYNSADSSSILSADRIDEEIGIYESEVFNGSNDLVSWRSLTWESIEPSGTHVYLNVRSGNSEDDCKNSTWSDNLEKNPANFVSIEHITNQYIQFRAILTSSVRDLSPSLTSVTLRNITAQSSHFYTTNFILPSKPIKGLLTANTFIPISADVVFGINTNNSTDFSDYQIIEQNRLFTVDQSQFGNNMRIGAKLLSPGFSQLQASNDPYSEYDSSSYICNITFSHINLTGSNKNYHFRIKFYSDAFRTQLSYVFFTGNDQTGWQIIGQDPNYFPSSGVSINNNSSKSLMFTPATLVNTDQKWYITIESYDGVEYELISSNYSYFCADCNISNELGLVAEYYKTGLPSMSVLPDFNSYSPDYSLIDSKIDFNLTSTAWVTTTGQILTNYIDNFAVRWKGRLYAPVSGNYSFKLGSDDGSKLFLDTEEIINNDGLHAYIEKEADLFLAEGYHNIEIQFFDRGVDAGIKLYWRLPTEVDYSIIPENRLFHAIISEYCDSSNVPRIYNFALIFELDNGEKVKINV